VKLPCSHNMIIRDFEPTSLFSFRGIDSPTSSTLPDTSSVAVTDPPEWTEAA